MILVDSSVWIDFFNGEETPQVAFLNAALGSSPIATGDIILCEVLRGFRNDKAFLKAKELLSSLFYYDLLGKEVAMESVAIYRTLRKKGVAISKPNDIFISAFCKLNGFFLLHSDKDFGRLARHYPLKMIG